MTAEEYDFQIIANLLAGKGEAKDKLEKLKNYLESQQQKYRVMVIETPTPISKIPEDGRIKIKKGVVCIGGDGTLSETVGYVLNNKIDVPIALIPTGTANIAAATLGLELEKNDFKFLLEGKVKEIDIGVAEYQNEKDYFVLGLGLGFEENFLRLTKERLKAKMGIFSYIFAAISELLSLKRIPLMIGNPRLQ
ncbi:MAG: diacylglycerol/lipid kinase family protein, partial [Microgenomates group bacterium]